MKRPPLRSFHVRNFKAIQDSGVLNFGSLTVFIGNNGSGKSSLIEALEAFRDIVLVGIDAAMDRWHGFEYVWNRAVKHELKENLADGRTYYTNPLTFRLGARVADARVAAVQEVTAGPGVNELFILREIEDVTRGGLRERRVRGADGWSRRERSANPVIQFEQGASMLKGLLGDWLYDWQFLRLVPDAMGEPRRQQRAAGRIRLWSDGSNVAEYLNEIRRLDPDAFNGILDALQFVLPFATDLQPALTSELDRAFYLKLKEQDYEVPGWLLSTGTLRILALLACLRHPDPPPVLIVEEVENGLDPRTLGMLLEEIRAAITLGTTQVILTTHSPYLLDLLALEHIVVVERVDGHPVFHRPDSKEVAEWAKSFAPGQLYTMGHLTRDDA